MFGDHFSVLVNVFPVNVVEVGDGRRRAPGAACLGPFGSPDVCLLLLLLLLLLEGCLESDKFLDRQPASSHSVFRMSPSRNVAL